jgi:heme/copper-type cytochrome/quinol oxidase subunit 1
MAQQETPNSDATPESSALEGILGTSDHKTIGRMWMVSGAVALAIGMVLTLIAAVEQVSLGSFSIAKDADELVQLWSAGRTLTLLAGVVALIIGLATYLVPLQVGSSAIAFGRGANAAFWIWAISVDLLAISYLLNGGPAGGRRDFVALWALSLGGVLVGIAWALICIATTVLAARAPGMTLERTPISAWAFCVWALSGLVALPIFVGHLILVYIDVRYQYTSDYVSLSSVVTGISLAPAIYWLAIAVTGIAAEIVGVHSGRPIRFHRAVMAGIGALAITAFAGEMLSFVGATRTFAEDSLGFKSIPFDNALLVVALFSSILPLLAIMALIGDSLRSGRATMNPPMLGALLGGALTLLGAVVGLLGTIDPIVGFFADLANRVPETPEALQLNNTTFNAGVTALIIGAAIVSVIGATHHWAHKIWGRYLTDGMGSAAIAAVVLGTLATAAGHIGGGVRSQSAFPAMDSTPLSGVEPFNALAAAGIALASVGVLIFAVDLLRTSLSKRVDDQRWSGHTLEWATDSPPAPANFATTPEVSSAMPILDMEQAERSPDELEEVGA